MPSFCCVQLNNVPSMLYTVNQFCRFLMIQIWWFGGVCKALCLHIYMLIVYWWWSALCSIPCVTVDMHWLMYFMWFGSTEGNIHYSVLSTTYLNWMKCLILKLTSLGIFCYNPPFYTFTHTYGWKHQHMHPYIERCGGWRGSLTLRCPSVRHLGSRCWSVCVCWNSRWKHQGLALAEWNTSVLLPLSALSCCLWLCLFSLSVFLSLFVCVHLTVCLSPGCFLFIGLVRKTVRLCCIYEL